MLASTSPPMRHFGSDRAAAQLRSQEPAFRSNVARPFQPSPNERLNYRLTVDKHRALARVCHHKWLEDGVLRHHEFVRGFGPAPGQRSTPKPWRGAKKRDTQEFKTENWVLWKMSP